MGNLLGGCKICLALSQLSFRLLSFRNVTKDRFRSWFGLIHDAIDHDFDIYLSAVKPDVSSLGTWRGWRPGILTGNLNPLLDCFSILRMYKLKYRLAQEVLPGRSAYQ